MDQFFLGQHSLSELEGVHPDLVAVVKRAITITPQDFSVHDGLRTLDEQRELLAKGASKTMDSRHLTGHAVDLVPVVNGKLRWEWGPIYNVAEAVRTAAQELQIPLVWGSAWDQSFTQSEGPVEHLRDAYAQRMRDMGKAPFLDGPHFELDRSKYPKTPPAAPAKGKGK